MPRLHSGEENEPYASEPKNEFQKFVRKNSTILTGNKSPKNGEKLLKIMEALPDGGSKDDLPIDLRPKSGYGNMQKLQAI